MWDKNGIIVNNDDYLCVVNPEDIPSYFGSNLFIENIVDSIFPGWCADYAELIRIGKPYNAPKLYSTLGCSVIPPTPSGQLNWDKMDLVNYLLFMYHSGCLDASISYNDIQAVIWALLNNGFRVELEDGLSHGGGISWDPAKVISITK